MPPLDELAQAKQKEIERLRADCAKLETAHGQNMREIDRLRAELSAEREAHAELRKLWDAGNEAWNPVFKIVLDERDALRVLLELSRPYVGQADGLLADRIDAALKGKDDDV